LLLASGRLDGRDDVPVNAHFGEGGERRGLVVAVVHDGLPQADHADLQQIFPFRADEKVRFDFTTYQVTVLVKNMLRSVTATPLGLPNYLVVWHPLIARMVD